MNSNDILATQNEAWGFWGTMNDHAKAAWPMAMRAISEATRQPLDSVRTFLDSRHGRHFADEVLGRLGPDDLLTDAISAAAKQWMEWKVSRRTSRGCGIPCGIPYLTGFVIRCAVATA